MKYKLENNCLLIYYRNNELKENATENLNECKYCEYNPKTCYAESPTSEVKKYGGQYCETMKCIYEEI